jgi:DNA replication protein DnaC
MLIEQTMDKMNLMKLTGMAAALTLQLESHEHSQLAFDERLGLLVDAEWTAREQRKLTKRLRSAKLRYPASFENIDFKHPRGLDRQQVLSLGNCAFVENRHNLLITGPTGIGKSYLACAFVERACRRGYKGAYARMPRLMQQIAVARGDGSYARILDRLAKLELLAIDDWLLAPLRDAERRDLVEVIEDRSERASTIIASQLLVKDWHAAIGDANLADSICDRLLHNAHRLELRGRSKRGNKPDSKAAASAATTR